MKRSIPLLLSLFFLAPVAYCQRDSAGYSMKKTYVSVEASSQVCWRVMDAPLRNGVRSGNVLYRFARGLPVAMLRYDNT